MLQKTNKVEGGWEKDLTKHCRTIKSHKALAGETNE